MLSKRRFNRLLKEIVSGNNDQRRLAAMELGYSKERRAIPYLKAALEDPDVDVCTTAICAYGQLAGVESIPALVQMMETQVPKISFRLKDTLERLLYNCSNTAELDNFTRELNNGTANIKDENALSYLNELRNKIVEKRASLEARTGILSKGFKRKPSPNVPIANKKRIVDI